MASIIEIKGLTKSYASGFQALKGVDLVIEAVFENREVKAEATKKAEAAKSQFVANMSHELCTPMNGIVGAMELLRDSPLEGSQRELVQTATRSSRSLASMESNHTAMYSAAPMAM